MISFSCFVNFFFCYAKRNYIIQYMIARREACEGTKQYHVWSIYFLVIEYAFILICPNNFLKGKKLYLWFYPMDVQIFYHYNDFMTIIMAMKFIYLMKGL